MTTANPYTKLSRVMMYLLENKELDLENDIEPMFLGLMESINLKFCAKIPIGSTEYEDAYPEFDAKSYFFDRCATGGLTEQILWQMLFDLTEPTITKL